MTLLASPCVPSATSGHQLQGGALCPPWAGSALCWEHRAHRAGADGMGMQARNAGFLPKVECELSVSDWWRRGSGQQRRQNWKNEFWSRAGGEGMALEGKKCCALMVVGSYEN